MEEIFEKQNGEAKNEEPSANPAEDEKLKPAKKQETLTVKFNGKDIQISLSDAAALAQKGMKFDLISEDFSKLKELAKSKGQSVSSLISQLVSDENQSKTKALADKCGGNLEMANHIIELEGKMQDDTGFEELKKEFPEIKDISEIPESVVERAKLTASPLLYEYLKHLHRLKTDNENAVSNEKGAERASVGSQSENDGGNYDPVTANFLRSIWG